MAITAESPSGLTGIRMATETLIPRIVMPWALFRIHKIRWVNTGIGSAHAVAVAMAAGLTAREAFFIMARGARFDVIPGDIGVSGRVCSRIPRGVEMCKRHSALPAVAVVAEGTVIMTALTFELLALGIEAVVETVV